MKKMLAGALLVFLIAGFAGCGGDDNSGGSVPFGPTKASGSASGATSASGNGASSSGGTCKYLSASEASEIVGKAGEANVTSNDSAGTVQTICTFGSGTGDQVMLIVNDFKSSPAASAIKSAMERTITEKIGGLGDLGGYTTKTPDSVVVVFVKGNVQVSLLVGARNVNAAAVVAAAKKIAGKL
jgi:hypothetical protein